MPDAYSTINLLLQNASSVSFSPLLLSLCLPSACFCHISFLFLRTALRLVDSAACHSIARRPASVPIRCTLPCNLWAFDRLGSIPLSTAVIRHSFPRRRRIFARKKDPRASRCGICSMLMEGRLQFSNCDVYRKYQSRRTSLATRIPSEPD